MTADLDGESISSDCGLVLSRAAEGMACEDGETYQFGQTVGVCSSGGVELNAWLVANGWA